MKTIWLNGNYSIIGQAEEIRAVEKSMRRAWLDDSSNIWPSHSDSPKFRDGDVYGIAIECGEDHDTYYIMSAATIGRLLLRSLEEGLEVNEM